MKISQKLLSISVASILLLAVIITVTGVLLFNREALALNKTILDLKLSTLIDEAKAQEDLYYEGTYSDKTEASDKIVNTVKVIYNDIQKADSNISIIDNVFPVILSSEGSVIVHPLLPAGDTSLQDLGYIKKIISLKNGDITYSTKGTQYYALFNYYPSLDWIFIYQIPISLRNKGMNNFIIIEIIVTLILVICFSLLYNMFIKSTFKPLDMVTDSLKVISQGEGDLSKRIDFSGDNEIGNLSGNFNTFLAHLNDDLILIKKTSEELKDIADNSQELISDKMNRSILEIKGSIEHIDSQTENATSGIEELSATIEEMSRNIESITKNMIRQSSSVEEGASSIEEMVRNIDGSALLTRQTLEISEGLNQVSSEGRDAVKSSIKSIREIAEYSKQIMKMLDLITGIAKQTNLLAMNAAIEAAHAGESGKGFAIVADEIRRLSEDTNKNTNDINNVINTIVKKIDDSVNLADTAGTGLDRINEFAGQNSVIMNQLSISMNEQSSGAKEILNATQEMVKITEEVRLSILEQKKSMDEFTISIRGLRDLSLENKESIQVHLENLNSIIKTQDDIKRMTEENQKHAHHLNEIVSRFVLDEKKDERTEIKLVE
jgi:methyl-accepting chemotaxis protein